MPHDSIKKITGNGLKPSDVIQGPEGAEGPSEVRYRAHVAFSTAYDMLNQMARITNRRKAVVWVSNGYDFDPFAQSRLGEDPVFGGRFGQSREEGQQMRDQFNKSQVFADADLARELGEVTRTANRANATIYTIDPRGLVAGADLDEQLDPVEYGEHVRKTQDSLRVLADETGGLAVVNQNDFDKGLKANRRGDERLLHARLHVDQSRPDAPHTQDRSEGDAAGNASPVAHLLLASAGAAVEVVQASGFRLQASGRGRSGHAP